MFVHALHDERHARHSSLSCFCNGLGYEVVNGLTLSVWVILCRPLLLQTGCKLITSTFTIETNHSTGLSSLSLHVSDCVPRRVCTALISKLTKSSILWSANRRNTTTCKHCMSTELSLARSASPAYPWGCE